VKEILKINSDAKVIVASGYSSGPIISNYKDFGFKGMIAKPFLVSTMKKALDKIMGE